MDSQILNIDGERIVLRIEPNVWSRLEAIASRESLSVSELVQQLKGRQGSFSLATAIRVFVAAYQRTVVHGSEAPQAEVKGAEAGATAVMSPESGKEAARQERAGKGGRKRATSA